MALARQTEATLIKPLEGAIVRRYTAGAAIAAGEIVSMQSDGFVDPTDTTSAAAVNVGVAITAAAASDIVDVVVSGPVSAIMGATPGGLVYDGTTAGEPEATSGGNKSVVGYAESATVLFVRI